MVTRNDEWENQETRLKEKEKDKEKEREKERETIRNTLNKFFFFR